MKPYECNCQCHIGKKKHAVACCQICSMCGKKIKNKFIKTHHSQCASARDPVRGATFDEISRAIKKSRKKR